MAETSNKISSQLSEEGSLVSRLMSLDMKTINYQIIQLFQSYSKILKNIVGDELIGNSQIREIYTDYNGVFKEYSKGRIFVKNGINELEYLLSHRNEVSKLIGVDSAEIWNNKRNLAKVKDYLNKLRNVCEIGSISDPMQIYISKHDGNIANLDSLQDWTDYILTQSWIDKLANRSIGGQYSPQDYRIEYLSDILGGMVSDHEIEYHKNLEQFTPSDYLNSGKDIPLEDAMNKLNSFGKLDYGFYELFKPIGGGKGKFIKVKVSTDGYVDISGVVGLSDCHHWNWEYGSEAYLRSLNTGNQRYLLQLDIPFNDESSNLWWKPDHEEKLGPDPDNPESPTTLYYKKYETERFLRWFGNDHVPRIDENTLEKCTVCSSPSLSNDTESNDFHTDSRNIGEMDIELSRTNIDTSTSQSLLSLYPRATIAIKTYFHDEAAVDDFRQPMEGDDSNKIHQYIEFIVTGNRQTYNVAFDVRGKIESVLQEKHHYMHTLNTMQDELERLFNNILFLQVSEIIAPEIVTVWNNLVSDFTFNEPWVPLNWLYLKDKLNELLKSPTIVDVLRFRQLDFETISQNDAMQMSRRKDEFLEELDKELDEDSTGFIYKYCKGDQKNKKLMYSLINNKQFFDNDNKQGILQGLYDYIFGFKDATSQDDLAEAYNRINLPTDNQKNVLVKEPLEAMYGKKSTSTKIKFSYNDTWKSYNIEGIFSEDQLPVDGNGKTPYAIEFGTTVTGINANALSKCDSLTSIIIPTSVTTIGENAFHNCTALQSIEFKNRTFADIKDMDNYPWGIENTYIINKGMFSDITVDILRERITTLNNLIVRLPVDSKHNRLASKHIFQDWKAFVDGAANYLKDKGQLTFESRKGLGSDFKVYEFDEYLVDRVPLVDYSWLYGSDPMNPYTDEEGNPIGDRWDYWTEEDFK